MELFPRIPLTQWVGGRMLLIVRQPTSQAKTRTASTHLLPDVAEPGGDLRTHLRSVFVVVGADRVGVQGEASRQTTAGWATAATFSACPGLGHSPARGIPWGAGLCQGAWPGQRADPPPAARTAVRLAALGPVPRRAGPTAGRPSWAAPTVPACTARAGRAAGAVVVPRTKSRAGARRECAVPGLVQRADSPTGAGPVGRVAHAGQAGW
jgi:hypothetical protein